MTQPTKETLRKSYSTSIGAVDYTPEGDLKIRVIGVPFGGPEYLGGKDLDNEYFSKSTDVGPLPVVLSYFHHGQDPDFGPELTGVAQKVGQSDEGWLYDVIVHRNHRYKDLLKRLAEEGHLGVSSTPYQATAQKSEDGLWKTWHVVELGLTPSPANPEARILVQKAMEEMANKKTAEDQVQEEIPVTAEAEAQVVDEQPEPEVEAQPEVSLKDMIYKALTEAKPSDDGSSTLIAELAKNVASIEERIERMEQNQEKRLNEIRDAFPALAKAMAEYTTQALEGQVSEFAQKSKTEREIEQRQKAVAPSSNGFRSALPGNAPGKVG